MSQEMKPITIKKVNNKLPVILNNKIILKKDFLPFKTNVKVVSSLGFQEDVIYDSKSGALSIGGVRVVTIVNRLNKTNNTCRTIAKCMSQAGLLYEKTSDDVAKLIGQSNYDTLFSTLCSVINQELKIRAIFSLLTIPKASKTVSCQSEFRKNSDSCIRVENKAHVCCQTDESRIASLKKITMRRKGRRSLLAPYVIRESEAKAPKKLVITPKQFSTILKSTDSCKDDESQKDEGALPDLGTVFDDESNNSEGRCSGLSINTTPELLLNPMSILENVDKVTRDEAEIHKDSDYKLHNLDTTTEKSSDDRPLSLAQVLQRIPPEQRVKLLMQQGWNDWHNCLNRDENGHLPIHVAVLNNDLDLLKRQCLVLKMRDISVDIPADNLTPLRMSLYQDNVQMTALLLQHNADALEGDAHDKNCFHVAAEKVSDHLRALVIHYQENARKILEENEELWKPNYANKSDAELSKILMTHINKLYNDQGYTPMMLASVLGNYDNVKLLVESSAESINTKMPSTGNTALYIAVAGACMDSVERGNKSKVVDHFRKTIEILVENGADPNSDNFNGDNVNDLLTEYNIGDLSMLIANKMTCRNFVDGRVPEGAKMSDSFMLIKDKDGNVDIKKLEKEKQHKRYKAPKLTKVTPVKDQADTSKTPAVKSSSKSVKSSSKSEKSSLISEKSSLISEKSSLISERSSLISEKSSVISEKSSVISEKSPKLNVATISPKKILLIKSETVTGQNAKCPVIVSNVTDTNKPDIVKDMPIVQNFRLNRPLILKNVASQNKRKIEISYEPSSKKANVND